MADFSGWEFRGAKGAEAMRNLVQLKPAAQHKASGRAAAGMLVAVALGGLILVASERSDAARQPGLSSVPVAIRAAPASDGLGRAGASSLAPLGVTVPITAPAPFHDATPPGLPGLDQSNVAWGDYDNDGLLDFLVTGFSYPPFTNVTRLYHNDGGGAFHDATSQVLPAVSRAVIAWVDYDNDGLLDLFVSGNSSGSAICRLYHNDGGGAFHDATPPNFPVPQLVAAAWGDYDNDGLPDLLMTDFGAGGSETLLFHNDGGGAFHDATPPGLPAIDGIGSFAWGDYDNDGRLDLLLTGEANTGIVSKLYHNDGGGAFHDATPPGLPAGDYGSVAWGDYDNDGLLDFVLTGAFFSKIYHNDGGGAFHNVTQAILLGQAITDVDWGDFDNDGRLDLIIVGDDSHFAHFTRLYHNDGGGQFTDVTPLDWPNVEGVVAWGDYDNDGRLDLLLMGKTDSSNLVARLYHNDAVLANTRPGPPGNLTSTGVTTNSVVLGWSAAVDTQTVSSGLSYNLRVGSAPGAADVVEPMANTTVFTEPDGLRRLPALGPARPNLTTTLGSLVPGSTYYWSVQTIDPALAGGPFASEGQFTTSGGASPTPSTPSPTPTICAPSWAVVPSPNPGTGRQLNAVTGSGNDVWAVGYYGMGGVVQTLTMHWDGSAWSVVPSPNVDTDINELYGVSGSGNDVWAVGEHWIYEGGYHVSRTLTLHWNGSAWSVVPSPDPGFWANHLLAATGTGSDVWAVGWYSGPDEYGWTFTLHWDGSAWSHVLSPNGASGNNALAAVTGSGNDVWAVGYYNFFGPVILHWDGSAWSVVPSPQPGVSVNQLFGVSGSGSDVWAVGVYDITGDIYRTLTLHWNGSAWSHVPSPNVDTSQHQLNLVTGSGNDVWAVGKYQGAGGYDRIVAMHWDGSAWSLVPAPNPGAGHNDIYGMFGSGNYMWAVGSYSANCCNAQTLTLQWASQCATNTPTITPTPSHSPTPSPTPTSCPSPWVVVDSPNANEIENALYGVTGSGNDVWAVGSYDLYGTASYRTLTIYWDGSAWSLIPSPNPGDAHDYLWGATGSGNDVWAVGMYNHTGGEPGRTLTLHWNGSAWSQVASPNGGGGTDTNALWAATGSGNDVWAVGEFGSPSQTLTLHWNGSAWSAMPSPNVGTDSRLYGVTGSGNDVWAVGISYDALFNTSTFTLHWNGSTWSVVPSPNIGTHTNYLEAVTGNGNDAWAVGWYAVDIDTHALMLHWDGNTWSLVTDPNIDPSGASLRAATGNGNDVWVVGFDAGSGGNPRQTLTLHWDGSAWSAVPSPNVGSGSNELYGVKGGGSDIWAVGNVGNNTLTLHSTGQSQCATSTPTNTPTRTPTSTYTSTPTNNPTNTPLPTQTPGGSYASPTPAPSGTSTVGMSTTTPTPTRTTCAIQFSDVTQGSTFYPYVHCLACLGIVSGYPDGTFRPNNNVTRGQLSKLVSNAAGFSETETTQMFQDEPVGSTFYTYTARLASRGYINGYPCGGPGEPCVPPSNLPYFRTNSNATRGQITKIDANAAGFSDPPIGQTFEDVLPGSAFYTYTERLASRSIMQGYPCNTFPSEPCVPPDNRPYFRPFNNATRGQTSKIVANSFFPDCQTPNGVKR